MMSIVRSAVSIIPVLATTACLTAGAGPVHPLPGAESVNVVFEAGRVRHCTRIQDITVSDGILRRSQNEVHPGLRARAYQRLRNVTAHEGGNTALVTNESSQIIPDPPAFKWTIEGVIYHCAAPDGAGASSTQ